MVLDMSFSISGMLGQPRFLCLSLVAIFPMD